MPRLLLSVVLSLGLLSVVAAEEKAQKKAPTVTGAFDSYKDGTLVIKVKGKKGDEPKAVEIKLADDLKATLYVGADKKEVLAKDGLKDVKPGTPITVAKGDDDKVTALTIGA